MREASGIATGVTRTVNVSGGAGNMPASTAHICLFRLGERQISIEMGTPPMINEGDEVMVAGSSGQVLEAWAYYNVTTGVEGDPAGPAQEIGGILLTSASMISIGLGVMGKSPGITLPMGVIFSLVGMYLAHTGSRSRRAAQLLRLRVKQAARRR